MAEYIVRLQVGGTIEIRCAADDQYAAQNIAAALATTYLRVNVVDQAPADDAVDYFTLHVRPVAPVVTRGDRG